MPVQTLGYATKPAGTQVTHCKEDADNVIVKQALENAAAKQHVTCNCISWWHLHFCNAETPFGRWYGWLILTR